MSARLHRLGNIFTRIDGLIRKNHLKEDEKPIWFDIYKKFPPKYEPTYKRLEPDTKVKEIFYKEDALRARIHKMFYNQLGAYNLKNNRKSVSQNLLETCQQYTLDGMSEEEAVEKLISVNKIEIMLKSDSKTKPNMSGNSVDKVV